MSLGSIWCSIWSRFLNAMNDVVGIVISVVKAVGELAIDLLKDLTGALTGNPFGTILLVGGVILIGRYLTGSKDDNHLGTDVRSNHQTTEQTYD